MPAHKPLTVNTGNAVKHLMLNTKKKAVKGFFLLLIVLGLTGCSKEASNSVGNTGFETSALPTEQESGFDSVKELNEDAFAWLYIPKTEINYPIVHHTDDSYYLNHNAKGNYTAAGAIFMGSSNFSNFSDRNTVIHGHHLYDGSMFGNLGKWEDQEYFDTHNVFYINTPTRNYKVEMIAYFVTPANGQAYTIDFRGDEDVEDWVNWVLSQSAVESGYEYKEGDRFVTLSTCMYNYADARGVLIGHMIPLA